MATKNKKAKITFTPKQVTKKLLAVLPARAQDILTKRYGLGKDTKRMTLEAIGKQYGITRERVRQVEEYSLNNIRKSDAYEAEDKTFKELHKIIEDMGAIVSEDELLDHISTSEAIQNHMHFLLVLGEEFSKHKEDKSFVHRWSVDPEVTECVHNALKNLYSSLDDETLLSEEEILAKFVANLKDAAEKYREDEIIKRWLSLSKEIDKNPLNEWGRADSPNVNVKGMRDYAYLVIRRHGSPIHFREVADSISELFGKKAHVATTHNELIKDPRFVLVGRGLYALSDWGYSNGVVKDVISEILAKNGPLTREEIIDKVLKERYVKENTVVVNLQNQKHFKKDSQGRYTVA